MITSQALLDAYRHPVVLAPPSTPQTVCTRLALCWVRRPAWVAPEPSTARQEDVAAVDVGTLARLVESVGVSEVVKAIGTEALAAHLPGTLARVFDLGLAGEPVTPELVAEVVGGELLRLPGRVLWTGVVSALSRRDALAPLLGVVGPEVLARCLPSGVLARVVGAGLAGGAFDSTVIETAIGIEDLARCLPVGSLLEWVGASLEAVPVEPEPITVSEFLASHWPTIQEVSRARIFRRHGLSSEEFAQELALYAGARAGRFDPSRGTIGVWLWNQARATQKALIRRNQRVGHEVQGSALQGPDDDRYWLDGVADESPGVEDVLVAEAAASERSDETLVRMALLRREATEKERGWIRAQLAGATSSQELHEATGYSGRYARLIGQRFRQRMQEQARV